MKQLIRFSLLLLVLILPITVSAHDFVVDGIYYYINGNKASVTYQGTAYDQYSNEYTGEVIIPSTVTYNGMTYSVTRIGQNAFRDCSGLTGVTIPNSVTNIGDDAFFNCTSMTSVTIGNSVTSIGISAFYGCTKLNSVHISDLEAWCKINFEPFVANFTANPLTCAHHLFLNGVEVKDLVIPSTITAINKCAFSGCTGLTSVTFPNSVTTIGDYAFDGCNCFKYSSITFSESISNIGVWAFHNTYISSIFFLGDIDEISSAFVCDESAGNIKYLAFYGNINNPIGAQAFWHYRRYTSERQRYINNIIIGPDVDCIEGMNVSPGGNIYSYNPVPPTADENTFLAYNSTVHVPASSLAAYFIAPYWSNFANIVGDAIEPTDVTISQDTIVLNITDAPINLSAVVTPANANPNEILWSSTKKNIATVSNGKVSAVGAGECDIIAQCLNRFDTCHVVVKDSTVTVTLDLQEAMVLPNHIITLTPSASPIMPDLSVTSTDPSVAAARVVNKKIQVVGIKEGTTTITVGSTDGTAIPATCLVTVYTEPGDLDCDGFVNISDVTILIDYLLDRDASQISSKNADVDGDGFINISDVTTLIDILLSGN